MPVICIGPVCIPLWQLLPGLVGLAHTYGYLKWVEKKWFTWKWIKSKICWMWGGKPAEVAMKEGGSSEPDKKTE